MDIPQQKSVDSQDVNNLSVEKENKIISTAISCTLINRERLGVQSCAIAFNAQASIMVTAQCEDIIVWKFDGGNLIQKQTLKWHTDSVVSLAFSIKCNWFASGDFNKTILGWKEKANEDWEHSQPQQQHTGAIMCLILNKNEDQLISCSRDETIKVWSVDCQQNEIKFDYALENKHQNEVYCISLNESETALVSCSKDKQIILWLKGLNEKWIFKNHVVLDDYGHRICFTGDNQIAWQQQGAGFTQIFQIENGNFIAKPELKITLKEGKSDNWLFPTIFNKQKQVMIQKHHSHVYIIGKQSNGQFKIEPEPIESYTSSIFAGLSEDGQYLVIYDGESEELKVYRLQY